MCRRGDLPAVYLVTAGSALLDRSIGKVQSPGGLVLRLFVPNLLRSPFSQALLREKERDNVLKLIFVSRHATRAEFLVM